MLTKLTNRLIQDDNNKFDTEVFVEAVVNPTRISKIERYSLMNEDACKCECGGIEDALESVTFTDTETPEDKLNKIYNACANSVMSETVEFNQKAKRLTMTKEDYAIVKNALASYKKAKTDEDKAEAKKIIKTFIGTVKPKLKDACDDNPTDAFMSSLINNICKIVCDVPYKKAKDDSNKEVLLAKIYLINKNI